MPHGQATSLLGKNFCLYSPIGAWLMMSLVIHAHSKLERLKCFSRAPPFEYDGHMGFPSNEQPICRRSGKHFRLTLGASYYSYCVHAI